MNAWTIYWLTRLEPIADLCRNTAAACFVALLGSLMFFPLASVSIEGIDKVKALRIYKTAAIALIVVGCLASIARAFLPTKTDLAIIFAGQWITNSEEVKALPDNVVKTMNKFMTDYIGDDDAAGK